MSFIHEDFLLQTAAARRLYHEIAAPLPVKSENGQIIISGARGRAVITPPAGTTVEISPSRKLGTRDLSTIRFRSDAKSGSLVTKVLLEPAK
jgi:hypothetical protein